jgi:hypothetical protein
LEDIASSFTVDFQSTSAARYVMQVKPLLSSSRDADRGPSGQKAILFELIDTTDVTRLADLKTQLTERLFVQMHSDLATIDLSASMISSMPVPLEHTKTMGHIIHGRVHDAARAMRECQQYLCLAAGGDDLERFPVDPLPLLKQSIENIREKAAEKNVTLRFMERGATTYTLASSEKLAFITAAILKVQVKDAVEDSVILVRLTRGDGLIALDFSNNGFGMPNDVLQDYLAGEGGNVSQEFADLQKAAAWVEGWGGLFEAVSGIGVGLHFTIHLNKFM